MVDDELGPPAILTYLSVVGSIPGGMVVIGGRGTNCPFLLCQERVTLGWLFVV